MNCSREEAQELLQAWAESSTQLRLVFLEQHFVTVSADMVVSEFNPHLLTLRGPEHVRVSFALDEAQFSYVDERDPVQIFERTVRLSDAASALRLDFSNHSVAILIEARNTESGA